MKKRGQVLSAVLALMLCLGLCTPALAEGDMGQAGAYNIISAGALSSAAVDENGGLWTWGYDYHGQLGNGRQVSAEGTPIQTFPVKVLDNVAAASISYSHAAAIRTDGSLWMWGSNEYGQLGNGGQGNTSIYGALIQTVPVKVMDNVAAVSCGSEHTAAIKTDGSLWMWGYNSSGQLGNGRQGNVTGKYGSVYQTVPVKVMDDVAAVACGFLCTAAIKTDGSLWMWGSNNHGQLGNGGEGNATTEYGDLLQTIPVKVLDNVVAVSCGQSYTAALKADGSLWTWGGYGLLGNGTAENSTVPVKVMDNVVAVSCGEHHTGAITADGTLWTWGSNVYGQLGNGRTATSSFVPVPVLYGVAEVNCGRDHTIAVKTDGTLWTWGESEHGQLGNGGIGNARFSDGPGAAPVTMQTVPAQITLGGGTVKPKVPAANIAYPSTQMVLVDDTPVEFQCYALKDANGYDTNYIKLRDLAIILNGTAAQFEVGWDGAINLQKGERYTPNGSELSTPYSGSRTYKVSTAVTKVNGVPVALDAIVLTDDQGGGYTYYKLRDLGAALGFTVDWSVERGIYIETN